MPGEEPAEGSAEQGPYIRSGGADDHQHQNKAEKGQGRRIHRQNVKRHGGNGVNVDLGVHKLEEHSIPKADFPASFPL